MILEWHNGDVNKVGIFDCNLKGRQNPVLNYIREKQFTEIEFIVLSHPHKDHYSGLDQLFDYVLDNGIVVKKFAHSLNNIGTEYWTWFELHFDDLQALSRIIAKANNLYENRQLTDFEYLNHNWQLTFDNSIVLECLSPSHDEIHAYQQIVRFDPGKNKRENSRAANLLSTVFKLQVGHQNILLTSDAEPMTFERLELKHSHALQGCEFSICQLPHHGSKRNYYPSFWNTLQNNGSIRHVIVSAGQHHHYHHPDFEVLKRFHDDGFLIHSTNIVNGMQEYLHYLTSKSLILDTDSDLAEEYLENGDRIFEIN